MHLQAPLYIISEVKISYALRRDARCSVRGLEGRHHKCHISDCYLMCFVIPCMLAQ